MHRWFPVPALLASTLWAIALAGLAAGAPARAVGLRSDRAAVATLAVHSGVALGFGVARRRMAVDSEPEWVRVQEAKHRRKGAWFAAWGLVVLGLGWAAIRVGPTTTGRPGPGAWFGSSLNLGFQPGMFLAEWAAIVARVRLGRRGAGRAEVA